jgi:predicted metalloprotease
MVRNRAASGSFVSPEEQRRFTMADNDGDRETVDRTTIVETGNGGGGSGGVLAVVLLIIVVLVLLFLFRGQLGLGGDKTEVQVPDQIDVNIN